MRLELSARPVRAVLIVACVSVSAMAGGCANSRTAEAPVRQWVGAPPAPIPGQRVAEVYKAEPGDPIKEAPVEPATRRAEPDDPNEPFSPNYGRSPGTPAVVSRSRVANAAD
jgi:hypothetical protein